jgi:hypothetical protein
VTAAGLVRLGLIGFGLAVSLLALDFLHDGLEEAFRDYGPAIWRLATALVVAAVLACVAAVVFFGPRSLIQAFVPEGASLEYGPDYGRWKTLGLMLTGGLIALPALDHLVYAVIDGHALDTAQALIELSLAIVLIVGPGACRRLIFRYVAHR